MTLCVSRENLESEVLRSGCSTVVRVGGTSVVSTATRSGNINNTKRFNNTSEKSAGHLDPQEANTAAIIGTLNSTSWAIVTTLTALQNELDMSASKKPVKLQLPATTVTADGASYPWILDHILSYPGSYEIPLRTMYTLNSSPRAQPLPQQFSRPTSPFVSSNNATPVTSPTSSKFPAESNGTPTHSSNDHFKSNLMAQISQLPSQPCSLPPSFITSFVRKCFNEKLSEVDFPQALTGLDYLRDLETRKKREIAGALERLGVRKGDLSMTNKEPEVAHWMRKISEKERKIEILYTSCYIGLRRWTLVNEMSLLPFHKSNCLAMLNTLYPPTAHTSPTSQLTPEILQSQRDGFWRYIQGVEKNGPKILDNLIHQGQRPGDSNGWASTRENIDNYLRAANAVIEECAAISGPDYFYPPTTSKSTSTTGTHQADNAESRGGRKVDSGISFSSDDRPSTSGESKGSASSASSAPPSAGFRNKSSGSKSLPTTPTSAQPLPTKPLSTLEKIAREIRKMRARKKGEDITDSRSPTPLRASDDVDAEMSNDQRPMPFNDNPRLRKQMSANHILDSSRFRSRNGSFVSVEGSADGRIRSKTPISVFDT